MTLLIITGLVACGASSSYPASEAETTTTTARTTILATGDTDCPNGGILVETGIDVNGNGTLDDDEVDTAEKICNGINGTNSLTNSTDEPAGINCAPGGVRIDIGLDLNNTLDAFEIESSEFFCSNGSGSVFQI